MGKHGVMGEEPSSLIHRHLHLLHHHWVLHHFHRLLHHCRICENAHAHTQSKAEILIAHTQSRRRSSFARRADWDACLMQGERGCCRAHGVLSAVSGRVGVVGVPRIASSGDFGADGFVGLSTSAHDASPRASTSRARNIISEGRALFYLVRPSCAFPKLGVS